MCFLFSSFAFSLYLMNFLMFKILKCKLNLIIHLICILKATVLFKDPLNSMIVPNELCSCYVVSHVVSVCDLSPQGKITRRTKFSHVCQIYSTQTE